MSGDDRARRITFMVAGCQRCGTTWIDAALRDHPQVHLPPQKQTYFFDRHFDRGPDWYLSQFEGVGPEHRAVGEVATGYCLRHAVPRLAAMLPHVKVIMAMRHPIERAYSNFQSRRIEQRWRNFADAVRTDPDLLERGHYIDQVELLLAHYPRERFLPLLYDDLVADDLSYLRSILAFIDVDASVASRMIGQRKNASGYAALRAALHRAGLKPVLRAIGRTPIGAAIRRRNRQRRAALAGNVDAAMREELIEHFRPYNARLAALLGRDLSAWDR
jgi:hypothetical protein